MQKTFGILVTTASFVAPLHAQVARFDATTDTIAIAGQTVLGTAATFEARVSIDVGGSGSVYFEQANGREHKQLALSETSVSGMGFTLPSNQTSLSAGVAVSTGVFHHIAFVRDGGEERIYFDGLLLTQRSAVGDIDDDGSSTPAVGAQLFQDTSFLARSFIGQIDTLRISNVARYSGASFSAPLGDLGTDEGTLLLYNFGAADLAGSQLADLSGNGHTGTLGVGFAGATAPEILSAVPEPGTWALLLAGAGLAGPAPPAHRGVRRGQPGGRSPCLTPAPGRDGGARAASIQHQVLHPGGRPLRMTLDAPGVICLGRLPAPGRRPGCRFWKAAAPHRRRPQWMRWLRTTGSARCLQTRRATTVPPVTSSASATAPGTDVCVRLLDTPHVLVGGRRHNLPHSAPALLLACLAMHGDWLPRERLMALFWPDAPDTAAQHHLRVTLHRSKLWLQGVGLGAHLHTERSRLRLQLLCDVPQMRAALGRADWATAVALHRAPLLAGASLKGFAAVDEWLALERDALVTAWRNAALRQAPLLEAKGDAVGAATLLQQQLAHDLLAEDVVQALLRVAAAAGQRSTALDTFERFAQRLQAELGLQPLADTVALAAALRRAPTPPPRTGAGRPRLLAWHPARRPPPARHARRCQPRCWRRR
jgi:DNA-binding SARP family transcriptional activator